MTGTKRKERMKRIISILLLILLVNCTTTDTPKDQTKSQLDSIVDVFKSIPIPKF